MLKGYTPFNVDGCEEPMEIYQNIIQNRYKLDNLSHSAKKII